MSVIPFPVPQQERPELAPTRPSLRLVPDHDHTWRLQCVEFDDGLEVRRFECDACGDVRFR